MYRKLRALTAATPVKRCVSLLAAILVGIILTPVAASAGLVVTASSAAAVPDPVFVQNHWTGRCLDQHYAPGATTTVFSYPTCRDPNPPNNQRWGVIPVPNTPFFRIINHRSGWCLSEPNPEAHLNLIYAEVCGPYPYPNKQLWHPGPSSTLNRVTFTNTFTGRCMAEAYPQPGTNHGEVKGIDCHDATYDREARGQWSWRTVPL
jgi:hypothetical protein